MTFMLPPYDWNMCTTNLCTYHALLFFGEQINVEVMEAKVNACEGQLQLLMHMSKMLQGSSIPTALCNLAMASFTESIEGVCNGTTINPCSGCSLPLEAKGTNATVKMPCGHSYHLLCFAVACSLSTKCRDVTCQQMIPEEWCWKPTKQRHPITPTSGKIVPSVLIRMYWVC